MGKLEGKVAIITNSSSGVGRMIAIAFAREGAKVMCSDIRKVPLEKECPALLPTIPMGRSQTTEDVIGPLLLRPPTIPRS